MNTPITPSSEGRNELAMSPCNATPVISFEELHRRYARFVQMRLYSLCQDAHVTEDLAQEVFLRAFRYLPRLRHDQHLGAWLYRIATNIYHDYARQQKRMYEVVNEYSWEGFQEVYNSDHPQDDIIDYRRPDVATQLADNELRKEAYARLNTGSQTALRLWYHNKPVEMQEVYRARRNLKEILERLERQVVA